MNETSDHGLNFEQELAVMRALEKYAVFSAHRVSMEIFKTLGESAPTPIARKLLRSWVELGLVEDVRAFEVDADVYYRFLTPQEIAGRASRK